MVQDHKQETINLHRDIAISMSKVNIPIESVERSYLVDDFKLFEYALGSERYLGNPAVLGTTEQTIIK